MKKLNLYVIEDDPFYREAIKASLDQAEFEVCLFPTAEDCLKQAESAPDLFLLDFELGTGKTGLELLQHFKAETDREIPAIFLSGQANVSLALQTMRSGVYDYLVKDEFDLFNLNDELKKLAGRVRNSSQIRKLDQGASAKAKLIWVAMAFLVMLMTGIVLWG